MTDAAAVLALHRELRALPAPAAVLAAAADAAPALCGFERAVIAVVGGGVVSAAGTAPLRDPAADALRRALLAGPVELRPRSEEAEAVRAPTRPSERRRASPLAEALGLGVHRYAAVRPERTTLALLIVDRAAPELSPADDWAVDAVAAVVAAALELVLLRRRTTEFGGELRAFHAIGQALVGEALHGEPALGDAGRLPGTAAGSVAGDAGAGVLDRLTPTERRVALLLARGQTNREISVSLVVSPETVKTHVANVLRKLAVGTRTEAAALVLRSGEAAGGSS